MISPKDKALVEFSADLDVFLARLREKAVHRFEYITLHKTPAIDAARPALRYGIMSAFNALNHWDTNEAIDLASEVLEGANCHTENAALMASAKANGYES